MNGISSNPGVDLLHTSHINEENSNKTRLSSTVKAMADHQLKE